MMLSFSFNVFVLIFFSLVKRPLICLSIADIKAYFHSKIDGVVTPCFSQQDWLHSFIPVIMLSLALWYIHNQLTVSDIK